MVNLNVGAGMVELVLDSGSSQLSVKGSDCTWRRCDGLGCSSEACPCGRLPNGELRTDCREHYYQPTGARLAGQVTEMAYGSQTDTVSQYVDSVSVPVVPTLACTDIVVTPASTVDTKSMVPLGEFTVYRVSNIVGFSSSNLLGVARPKGTGTVVVDKLLNDEKTWGVVMHGGGGWLSLGALPCFTPTYVPLVTPRAFDDFVTKFYILNILSIAVGPSADVLTPVADAPKYCIVDTGTTNTYGSPKLGSALHAAGFVESKSVFQLQLGTARSSFTLRYTSTQLQNVEAPKQSVLEVMPGRTLSDFTHLFPDKSGGVLLMGAVMMKGFYWEFDMANNRVGLVDLRGHTS